MDNDNVQALCSAVVDAWKHLLDLEGLLNAANYNDLELICWYMAQYNQSNENLYAHNEAVSDACLRLICVLGNNVLLVASFAGDGINPHPVD